MTCKMDLKRQFLLLFISHAYSSVIYGLVFNPGIIGIPGSLLGLFKGADTV